MNVFHHSWKQIMINQKDVAAGESLENIMKKKRLTKAIEPLIYKMMKNSKSWKGKKNNISENEGEGVDTVESLGADELEELAAWHESFVKYMDSAAYDYVHDHCWQLGEDFIELRFYIERLYTDMVDEPSQKRRIILKEALK